MPGLNFHLPVGMSWLVVSSSFFILSILISITSGAKDFTPNGMYDLSPAELDQLCKTVDPGFEPMAGSDPCVYMKWTPCPSGGTKTQPCGWYQQTLCEQGKRRKRQRNVPFVRPRRHSASELVRISWPQEPSSITK